MEYRAEVSLSKVLEEVLVHTDVWRVTPWNQDDVLVWQRTDLIDEEAHPEPWKWVIQHLLGAIELW